MVGVLTDTRDYNRHGVFCREFCERSFSNMDQISVALRDLHTTTGVLTSPTIHETGRRTLQPFHPWKKMCYPTHQSSTEVTSSYARDGMFFMKQHEDQRTLQAEDKGHIHIPTRCMDPPSDPRKGTAMARVLHQRVACIETIASCTSMVTLKTAYSEDSRIQKLWTRPSSKISQKARS
jgi:hypothetical protein